MKNIFLLLLSTIFVFGAEFTSYGNFSEIIKTKNLSGVVDISELRLDEKNVYAMGAFENAEGEITVFDGEPLLSYGKEGSDRVFNKIPKKKAMLLAIIRPERFVNESTIEEDIEDVWFYDWLEERAKSEGIDLDRPFLFILEGEFKNTIWHIVDGKNEEKPKDGEKQKLMKKVFVENKTDEGIVFGVYAKENQGVFTHPGENYHAHGVFKNKTRAGHIDEFTVTKGSKIRIAQ